MAIRSEGPIKDVRGVKRLAARLRKAGVLDAAWFAENLPGAVLARPETQRELLELAARAEATP